MDEEKKIIRKRKEEIEGERMVKTFIANGYVYTLIEGRSRAQHETLRVFPQPCFMGFENMALKAVKRVI